MLRTDPQQANQGSGGTADHRLESKQPSLLEPLLPHRCASRTPRLGTSLDLAMACRLGPVSPEGAHQGPMRYRLVFPDDRDPGTTVGRRRLPRLVCDRVTVTLIQRIWLKLPLLPARNAPRQRDGLLLGP